MTYPRPDFQRSTLNWASLNGPWTLIFDDADTGLTSHWQHGLPRENQRQITVPFAFQTPASGIGVHEVHEVLWYERTIRDVRTPDEAQAGNRLLVRFGAVDYECQIWLDGVSVGAHRGGHVPFDVDVTDALTNAGKKPGDEARLTLRIRDSATDLSQPRGKQYWGPVPQSIFYTPTSGIWQTVWTESVPALRLVCGSGGTVLRSDDIKKGVLHARVGVTGRRVGGAGACSVEIEAGLGGKRVSMERRDLGGDRDYVDIEVNMKAAHAAELKKSTQSSLFAAETAWQNGVALWHPDHPILYDLTLRLYDASGGKVDEVLTTTGMRHLSWQNGDGTFRINGRPFFQTMVLDQGYWDGTGLTPPSPAALRDDILLTQRMGFSGCRKHQKVEDPVFYYWADRLGFLVWGEMANAYAFGTDFIDRVTDEWLQSVRRDINHPSVVTWTPANESWGYTSLKDNVEQRNHLRALYFLTKTLDPTRPINDNCGWEHVQTDLTTYHDYSDSAELAATCEMLESGILGQKGGHDMFVKPVANDPGAHHKPGAPIICSEYGGVNIAPSAADAAVTDRDWGYTTATDPNDFLDRFERLTMAVVKGGYSHGVVYTQLYVPSTNNSIPDRKLTDLKIRHRTRGQRPLLHPPKRKSPRGKSTRHHGRCARLLLHQGAGWPQPGVRISGKGERGDRAFCGAYAVRVEPGVSCSSFLAWLVLEGSVLFCSQIR